MSGRAAAKGARTRKAGRRFALRPLGPGARRWVFFGGFTLALLVGLPVAHALLGDVGAILLGTFALGFVVGRMTMKR
jgi:hypothetical protein